MADLQPIPEPRKTLTHAGCVVSTPVGYRPLQLDLHVPPGDGPFPVLLWIHGGGWVGGSRVWTVDQRFHERMVGRGYAVADVDYRLALEATYPAQQADIEAAIRWLRHHAAALRLDPGRFAALGESAGGQSAAIAGLTGAGDTALQAVILWYGPTDLSSLRNEDDPFTSPALLLGGPLAERAAFARLASPLHNVHTDAPPFLLVHGTDDEIVPFADAVGFAAAMRAQGVRCDVLPVEGAGHVFTGASVEVGTLTQTGADFLDDVLGHAATSRSASGGAR
ncbi:alpha/beta hydrolase [Dactylosporangium matsuzakiense]|uniref:Lipase n=1 Tax=Dactylosporangium matsuzakiense TaxID=53360 RepID=A0A9W6NR20_9ACTN|nr:alpha/beta hydrolase [Dactylosporangium matsuzakiense]GLL05938.1 lipase [Dactylosporangium matsuzakiense]